MRKSYDGFTFKTYDGLHSSTMMVYTQELWWFTLKNYDGLHSTGQLPTIRMEQTAYNQYTASANETGLWCRAVLVTHRRMLAACITIMSRTCATPRPPPKSHSPLATSMPKYPGTEVYLQFPSTARLTTRPTSIASKHKATSAINITGMVSCWNYISKWPWTYVHKIWGFSRQFLMNGDWS